MKYNWLARMGTPWLCLAATTLLIQGCAPQQAGWSGIYTIDSAGGAKTCVVPAVSIPDGKAVLAQVQVSDEGGWCGVSLSRGEAAYASYLLVTRPDHGRVLAHHVGSLTRIDYTPDIGFVGADKFAVRLIPGDAVLEEAVTVTK